MYYVLQVKQKLHKHESAETYEYNKMEILGESRSLVPVKQKLNETFGNNYCPDRSTIERMKF